MNSSRKAALCAVIAGLILIRACPAFANSVNFSTTSANASNWAITGAGAVASPADAVIEGGTNDIAFTSNSTETGTFISGASNSQFNGFWFADYQFNLPANASNAVMTFSTLAGDDRVVLELNSAIIGDFFLNSQVSNSPLTGAGKMSFPPGPPDQAYTFTGVDSGTVSSGFSVGTNDIRMVVNNTNDASLNAPTVPYQFSGDGAWAGVTGTVTYTLIPEPSSLCLLVLSSIGLLHRRRPSRPK